MDEAMRTFISFVVTKEEADALMLLLQREVDAEQDEEMCRLEAKLQEQLDLASAFLERVSKTYRRKGR
jgi:hypothetical protein